MRLAEMRSLTDEITKLGYLAGPLALGFAAQVAIGLTDIMLAGGLDLNSLAAVGLATSIYDLYALVLVGLAVAVAPVFARRITQGDVSKVQEEYIVSFRAQAFSALLFVPIFLASTIFLGYLTANSHTQITAVQWSIGASPSLVGFAIYILNRSVSLANEQPGNITRLLLYGIPANAALGSLLCFGFGSWTGFGAFGLGAATGIVWCGIGLVSTLHCRQLLPTVGHRTQYSQLVLLPSRRFMKAYWAGGGAVVGRILLGEGLWAASTMIAAPLGTPELATHVLLLQFILVTEVIGLSLGGAASVRIARLIASQEMVRAKRVSILAIASGLVFSGLLAISLLLRFDLITSALFFLLPEQSEVIEGLSSLLPIVSIVLMLSTLFAITSACLLGYDEASSSLAAAIWCLWGIGVTSAFLFSQTQFGLNGLWFGLALGAGAATAVVLCSIRSRTREGSIHESP